MIFCTVIPGPSTASNPESIFTTGGYGFPVQRFALSGNDNM